MCDEWMPIIKVPLTPEQFLQLPRHPAYKYEYCNNHAYLSPRPRHYHALLELGRGEGGGDVAVRRIRAEDLPELEPVFAHTFSTIQPFGSLEDATRREAARQCLQRTRTGGDGPWIRRASFVAELDRGLVGAVLITLLPEGDPCDWDSYHWREPPPVDAVARRLGRPHLTWIFVSPWQAGRGVGTALLSAAVNELVDMGFRQLLTTFMTGNDSSMLWHWRNGFRLLAYPDSSRRLGPGGRLQPSP